MCMKKWALLFKVLPTDLRSMNIWMKVELTYETYYMLGNSRTLDIKIINFDILMRLIINYLYFRIPMHHRLCSNSKRLLNGMVPKLPSLGIIEMDFQSQLLDSPNYFFKRATGFIRSKNRLLQLSSSLEIVSSSISFSILDYFRPRTLSI